VTETEEFVCKAASSEEEDTVLATNTYTKPTAREGVSAVLRSLWEERLWGKR